MKACEEFDALPREEKAKRAENAMKTFASEKLPPQRITIDASTPAALVASWAKAIEAEDTAAYFTMMAPSVQEYFESQTEADPEIGLNFVLQMSLCQLVPEPGEDLPTIDRVLSDGPEEKEIMLKLAPSTYENAEATAEMQGTPYDPRDVDT